jgi:hypothetical protein
MVADIVGSHEKAKNGYGQNGYQGASSLTPGQSKKNVPSVSPPSPVADAPSGKSNANALRRSANMNASSDDARMAQIQNGGAKPHDSMRRRSGEGGVIPSENVRRANMGKGH